MDMLQFGRLIKTLRQQQNMKQEEFASLLGVSVSAISKWENGKNLPDIELLKKISDLFQISMDDLCNPKEALDKLLKPASETSLGNQPQKPASEATPPATQEAVPTDTIKPVKYKILGMLFAGVIVIFLAGIGIYKLRSSHDMPEEVSILPYSFRTTQDEVLGTIFEIGCLYEGDIEELSLSYPLILSLCKDWQNNTAVAADIHYIKLSFYQEEADIHAWTTPDQVMYIYRE